MDDNDYKLCRVTLLGIFTAIILGIVATNAKQVGVEREKTEQMKITLQLKKLENK